MVAKDRVYPPTPPQGVMQSNTGKIPLAHNFQHHCGRCHTPLGESGSRGVDRPRCPREVDTDPGGVFICQQKTYWIDTGRIATTGLWCPHRPLWLCWPKEKCTQDSDHSFTTVPLPRRHVGRCVHCWRKSEHMIYRKGKTKGIPDNEMSLLTDGSNARRTPVRQDIGPQLSILIPRRMKENGDNISVDQKWMEDRDPAECKYTGVFPSQYVITGLLASSTYTRA